MAVVVALVPLHRVLAVPAVFRAVVVVVVALLSLLGRLGLAPQGLAVS